MSKITYQDLQLSLDVARRNYQGYHSECVLFAASFTRGLVEYANWPRDLVEYEGVDASGSSAAVTQKPEEAMRLDEDGFWHFGLRLAVQGPKSRDVVRLKVKFKKLDTRYIMSLFGGEDFEVAAPTPDNLAPVFEAILSAVKRHYDFGLRLFLENGGRGLKLPISASRLGDIARGDGK